MKQLSFALLVKLYSIRLQGGHGLVIRPLDLHVVALGSNPILTSGQDLFPVLADSTFSGFVDRLFSIMYLLSVKLIRGHISQFSG